MGSPEWHGRPDTDVLTCYSALEESPSRSVRWESCRSAVANRDAQLICSNRLPRRESADWIEWPDAGPGAAKQPVRFQTSFSQCCRVVNSLLPKRTGRKKQSRLSPPKCIHKFHAKTLHVPRTCKEFSNSFAYQPRQPKAVILPSR